MTAKSFLKDFSFNFFLISCQAWLNNTAQFTPGTPAATIKKFQIFNLLRPWSILHDTFLNSVLTSQGEKQFLPSTRNCFYDWKCMNLFATVTHKKSRPETCDELILKLVLFVTQLTNLYCCTV